MSGRRIGILGLARSGRAAALLALSAGERVFASDAGTSPAALEAAEAVEMAGGEAELGGHTPERLAECELLVVSPGIPPAAPVLNDPRLAGVPRISELEFAFCHLRSPVVAVTGTNGKSTTTALTAHLLRAGGLHAVAAGNIGLALSEVALYEKAPEWVVVEASSFQLAGIESFAPRVGVFTNLAPDHLDRYSSVEAYYADKARLFKNSTDESAWVLNGEDAAVLALPGGAHGRRYRFRTRSRPARGELGAFLADGVMAMRLESWDLPLVRADELRMLGEHNAANALAASLAAALAGAPVVAIRDGLRSFRGLEHRLEVVGEWDGVLWVNDSKATNIASTLVALRSVQRPIVLLLGGRHKGEPYTAMIPELRDRVRLVVAYGEAAPIVEQDLRRAVRVERIGGSFEDVVEQASHLAHPGDAVLLSPACSSFDMFSSYEERGRRFKDLARQVAEVRHGG
ncbi:MAG TPA: UDP-N-acetylmuramoyl-L-alanine--D-glutamate ligase [Longimicrobiales bacterium]|nr:UDP-N-acetylmuramoyl-L-alanine--D-glutamate ligase [Longimicrobiales bacterium]